MRDTNQIRTAFGTGIKQGVQRKSSANSLVDGQETQSEAEDLDRQKYHALSRNGCTMAAIPTALRIAGMWRGWHGGHF